MRWFCNGSRDLSEQYGRVYVGQTGRTIATRAKEHAKVRGLLSDSPLPGFDLLTGEHTIMPSASLMLEA